MNKCLIVPLIPERISTSLVLLIVAIVCSAVLAQDTVRTEWIAKDSLAHSAYAENVQLALYTHTDTDGSGNTFVATTDSEGSFRAAKFSAEGHLIWSRSESQLGLVWGDVYAMAVDEAGCCYLAGIGNQTMTKGRGFLTKLDPDGDSLWFRWTTDFWGSGCDAFTGYITVDDYGNAYVLASPTCSNRPGFAVAKFYPNGDTAWVRFEHKPAWQYDRPRAITVDSLQNVYFIGTTYGGNWPTNYFDYFVAKFQENGDKAWSTQVDMSPNDEPHAIDVDRDLNVYVTGEIDISLPDSSWDTAYGTVKLNSDGDTIWTRVLPTRYRDEEGATKIAIDGNGDIVISGGGYSAGEYGFLTLKYTPEGDTLWTRIEHFSGLNWAGSDRSVWFDLDNDNSIYVTGTSVMSVPSGHDVVTFKYNALGDMQWVHAYNNEGQDYAKSVSVKHDGTVVVGILQYPVSQEYNFVLLKLRQVFRCGDINGSGIADVADAISLVLYLFASGDSPKDFNSGDLNCNGRLNLADAVFLINYIFSGGPTPCAACL